MIVKLYTNCTIKLNRVIAVPENCLNADRSDEPKTGLEAVRDRVESLTWLAQQLGITRGAVTQWSDRIPAERVGEISRLTGLAPSVLRPDIFDLPADQPAA
jgi:hypothetical protein